MKHEELERSELNQIFDSLSHPYRRRILTRLDDLRDEEAEALTPEDVAIEGDDLVRLTTKLYHVHLPKLDDAGYVEWDHDTNTIRHGPRFDEVAPVLELVRDNRDALPGRWP